MKYLKLFVLFIFPLALFAQEKVFFNARIFTADIRHPFAEAIAIKEKKILSVGSYDDVKKSVGAAAEWIDCKGNFLMPQTVKF